MANKLTNTQYYTDIANAIRAKNGETTTYTPSQMANAIANIPSGDKYKFIVDGSSPDDPFEDDDLTSINQYAFAGSTIKNGNFKNVRTIGTYAFYKCTNLVTLSLPNVQYLSSYYTFADCTSLKSISCPKVIDIGNYVFSNTGNASDGAELEFPNVTQIGQYSFQISRFKKISIPSCRTINDYAFSACEYLEEMNLPVINIIYSYAFRNCYSLKTVTLKGLHGFGDYSIFYGCRKLEKVDIDGELDGSIYGTPISYYIGIPYQCFAGSSSSYIVPMKALILRKTSGIVTLRNVNAFDNNYIKTSTTDGYIYVPSALIDTYKSATNWSTFASKFRAIEDYPDICG